MVNMEKTVGAGWPCGCFRQRKMGVLKLSIQYNPPVDLIQRVVVSSILFQKVILMHQQEKVLFLKRLYL